MEKLGKVISLAFIVYYLIKQTPPPYASEPAEIGIIVNEVFLISHNPTIFVLKASKKMT